MTRQQLKAIQLIDKAYEILQQAKQIVVMENKLGKQFDFVTSSGLSNSVDDLLRETKAIEKITYQK